MSVHLTPEAQKQYSRLSSPDKSKIAKKLLVLENQLNVGKKLGGAFEGLQALRVWPYRIIYLINNKKEAWIVSIKHRQETYK